MTEEQNPAAAGSVSSGVREALSGLQRLPIVPVCDGRRPWTDDPVDRDLNTYGESDVEWCARNVLAVRWLIDNHSDIRDALARLQKFADDNGPSLAPYQDHNGFPQHDQLRHDLRVALTREEAPREDAGDVARLREVSPIASWYACGLEEIRDASWPGDDAVERIRRCADRYLSENEFGEALATSPAGTDEGSAS